MQRRTAAARRSPRAAVPPRGARRRTGQQALARRARHAGAKSALAPRALLNGLARAGKRVVAVGQRGHVLYQRRCRQELATGRRAGQLRPGGGALRHAPRTAGPSDTTASCCTAPTPASTWTRQLDGRQLGDADGRALQRERRLAPTTRSAPRWSRRPSASRRKAPRTRSSTSGSRTRRNGYVVGAFGLMLRTTDGGAHWQPLLHAADNPKGLHLYAVRGIGGDVYIAGEQGLLLKLDRDSGRFRALELPYKGTLFGVVGNAARRASPTACAATCCAAPTAAAPGSRSPTGLQVGLTASTLRRRRPHRHRQPGRPRAGQQRRRRELRAAKVERPLPAAAVVGAAQGRARRRRPARRRTHSPLP